MDGEVADQRGHPCQRIFGELLRKSEDVRAAVGLEQGQAEHGAPRDLDDLLGGDRLAEVHTLLDAMGAGQGRQNWPVVRAYSADDAQLQPRDHRERLDRLLEPSLLDDAADIRGGRGPRGRVDWAGVRYHVGDVSDDGGGLDTVAARDRVRVPGTGCDALVCDPDEQRL